MRKILLLAAVFAFVGTAAVQAQCTKSKTAATTTKKACTKSTAVKVADGTPAKTCTKAADTAMMQDLSIVKKVSDSGDVSYARKKTCAASGKVSYDDVKYCSKSNAFVNVAPMNDATAITVAGAEKKVCSSKVSYNEVKYCSDSKAFVNAAPAKKSCSKSGAKKACSKPCTKGAKASMVKPTNNEVKVIKTSTSNQ